jgi:uncharacterized spore protein YtfJ
MAQKRRKVFKEGKFPKYMNKKILMPIAFMILVCGLVLVSAEAPSSGGGGGGGAGARIFYIDDTFEIIYKDGIDTYEAGYKVWKIEEQDGIGS